MDSLFLPYYFPLGKQYSCENAREASIKLGESSVFQKKLLLDFPLSFTVILGDNNAYSLYPPLFRLMRKNYTILLFL